jgi:hypothetical protein
MPIRWLDVLRDALAIVIASALVRAVALGAGASDEATAAFVLGVFAVGFCVSGCLSATRRFAHLGLVAIATWLILALYAVATGGVESSRTYVSLFVNPILIGMLLGGAASLAIVRRPTDPPGPAA